MHDPKNMQAYLGTEEIWTNSEKALRGNNCKKWETPIEALGEAAFYGPKIDFLAKDAIRQRSSSCHNTARYEYAREI